MLFKVEFLKSRGYETEENEIEPFTFEAPYLVPTGDQNFYLSAMWIANERLSDLGYDQLKAWNKCSKNEYRRSVQARIGGKSFCVALTPLDM